MKHRPHIQTERPFAHKSNMLLYAPWTQPGYKPLIPRKSLWERIVEAWKKN